MLTCGLSRRSFCTPPCLYRNTPTLISCLITKLTASFTAHRLWLTILLLSRAFPPPVFSVSTCAAATPCSCCNLLFGSLQRVLCLYAAGFSRDCGASLWTPISLGTPYVPEVRLTLRTLGGLTIASRHLDVSCQMCSACTFGHTL